MGEKDLMSTSPEPANILTVSELTVQLKNHVEDRFNSVWVSGEISNVARPQSGHIYLTLKDEHAQLRAARPIPP